jgi:hypothetical protein
MVNDNLPTIVHGQHLGISCGDACPSIYPSWTHPGSGVISAVVGDIPGIRSIISSGLVEYEMRVTTRTHGNHPAHGTVLLIVVVGVANRNRMSRLNRNLWIGGRTVGDLGFIDYGRSRNI